MSGIQARWFGGFGAVLLVALIAVLFVTVLHQGPGKPITAVQTNTPVIKPTSTLLGKTPEPSPTDSPTPVPLNFPSAASVWGPNAATTLTPQTDTGHVFLAQRVSPDGATLYGNQILPSKDFYTGNAGWYAIASKHFTLYPNLTPGGGMAAPDGMQCCNSSTGRYLVAEDDATPGATCGPCHLRLWSYDLQTGQERQLVQGVFGQALIDHDTAVYLDGNGQLIEQNAITGVAHPVPNIPAGVLTPIAIGWPYVVYTVVSTQGTSGTTHVRNLQTGADVTIAALAFDTANGGSSYQDAIIAGGALFYTTQSGNTATLEMIQDPFAANAQPTAIATYGAGQGALTEGNDRLLIFNGVYTFAYDRARQTFVSLSSLRNDPSQGQPQVYTTLTGNWLLVTQTASAQNPYAAPETAQLYNLATLPQG